MTVSWLPLKRLVDPVRPITYGIVQAGPDYPDGTPYIRPADMDDERGIRVELRRTDPDIAATYKRSTVKTGDLVVSIGPSFGKVLVVPEYLEGANLTQGTARVAPAHGVIGRYLFWVLRSDIARNHWVAGVSGATFGALTLELLSSTPCPIRSTKEQGAIAEYLDRQTAHIDSLMDRKERLIQLLDERSRGSVSASMTGWPQVPLKRVTERGPTYGLNEPAASYLTAGIRFIRTTDIGEDGALRENGVYLREVSADAMLRPGDLVFSRSGTLGRAYLHDASVKATFAGYLVRFRLRPEMSPRFIWYFAMSAAFDAWLRTVVVESTIGNVNGQRYAQMPVPMPPREEQDRIVEQLDKELDVIKRLKTLVVAQVDRLRERRAALITAAVAGQLDVARAS